MHECMMYDGSRCYTENSDTLNYICRLWNLVADLIVGVDNI